MDDVGFGRLLRAIRIRRGWRQADVAGRAGVSRARVSLAERGRLEELRLGEARRIGAALEVRVRVDATWRGGDADRLVNQRHVALQGEAARILGTNGWTAVPEATFSIRGERGAIDLLGWRDDVAALLIGEMKSEIADPGGIVGQVDRYRRLAQAVASERGWRPRVVGVWVVVGESTMNRGRYRAAATLLRAAFPDGIVDVRRWLRHPDRQLAALTFLRCDVPGSTKQVASAVRRVSIPASRSGAGRRIAG